MSLSWLSLPTLLLTVCSPGSGSQFDGLKVRWGMQHEGYYDLPWTYSEVVPGPVWHLAGYDPELKVNLVSHFQDHRLFLLFDESGTIAGVRFGFHKLDLTAHDSAHRYTFPRKMFKRVSMWKKTLWLATVIFAEPDVIKNGGRPNLRRDTDHVVSSLHSRWYPVPRSECDVTAQMSEQACYPGMGKHYFHKTDQSTVCAEWQGIFVTYDQGLLAGFGIDVLGTFAPSYSTPYYEYPAFPVVKAILSNRPPCVDQWLPHTGITSVHVFVRTDAANMTCPDPDWRTEHCPSAVVNPDVIVV